MFAGLQKEQLKGALEAMLLVTDEPVGTITLADMLEVEPSEVEYALVDLRAQLEDEDHGIQLRELAGGWRLFTHPAYHELIERYVLSWDTRKLSQAAMETLAIVAYTQPVTRAGVAAVRGVASDSSINSLVEKGLIREAGTEDSPGSPVLYATTKTFLEKFGLRSVAELPPLEDYAPDEEAQAFIRERLSATRGVSAVMPQDLGSFREGGAIEDEGDASEEAEAGQAVSGGQGVSGSQAGQGVSEGQAEGKESQEEGKGLLAQALAQGMGLVEKVDLEGLGLEE
ncbi:MAG: SMC-Scp complex subunit ScpB [Coriobacteriaceae bacterium]|jgi:segregation and condensation protein B|nr:SMC-Scp complex subunit ScpB [Coriobacteriaceae bacterium]